MNLEEGAIYKVVDGKLVKLVPESGGSEANNEGGGEDGTPVGSGGPH